MPIRRILKRQQGREFYRCRKKLSLRLLPNQTGYSRQKIDKVEIGQTFNWDIYNKLYNFYNPKIDLIPVDPGYHADRRRDGRFFDPRSRGEDEELSGEEENKEETE